MDRKPRIRINCCTQIAIMNLLLLCAEYISATNKETRIEETQIDTYEGSTVQLQCRFPPMPQSVLSFWLTHTNHNIDNAAFGNISMSPNYDVFLNLKEGRYDLQIKNVSYERDNGRYECKMKDSSSGRDSYRKYITLTVLRAPSQPTISPTAALAMEGQRLDLQCNTFGGSPEPEVRWYRGDSRTQALHTGKTLSIEPRREDDAVIYRCVVRNRAMREGETLEAAMTLNVNYHPRVTVGPANPLKIEVNGTANLECHVDSKPMVRSVRWLRENGNYISMDFQYDIARVTLEDAGRYTCQADNNLSKKGEAYLMLDVLYPPTVSIEGDTVRIIDVEDTVTVHCNVSANPMPSVVEWLRDGRPEFRQSSSILRLTRVTADHAGNYTCRAVNTIHPTGGERKNYTAFASMTIRVRHKPGPARMTPDSPVAVEGSRVILTCMASPAGYPEAQYKWWKETEGSPALVQLGNPSGPKFEIDSVHLGSEGTYRCSAVNEIGVGEAASVNLTVHQPPKILTKLQPYITRKVGESSFQVSCVAQGKPRPSVRWLKDDHEITAEERLYKVSTSASEGHGSVITVNSTLSFLGHARPQTDEIVASDRGKYTCVFVNEVKKVESTMMFKVEHKPIVLHKHGKVAYNLRENAEITCMVQAWPKPEMQWSYGMNAATLQGSSSDGHYDITASSSNNDVYISTLRMPNIQESDYGNYSCRANNIQGSVTSTIRLQRKGAPERPTNVSAMEVGPTYVALEWQLGFDGGLPITKYFVSYRRVAGGDEIVAPDCAPPRGPAGQWLELDCKRSNPCNVTKLEQHQTYTFKVKVYNTKNHSDYSEEVTATTAVAKIPAPHRVSYDPESGTLLVSVNPTCLAIVASIEKFDGGSDTSWRIVDEWPLEVLGTAPTQREGVLDDPETVDSNPRLRIRLCLKADRQKCGEYAEAEIGSSYIAQTSAFATPTLIALIVSGAVFLLFAALLLLFCRCRRKHATKAKDYEMDSNATRPSLVATNGQQTQPPPPYYAENKALEHSLDHALALEDSKTPAYSQSGYGYHQPNHNINGVNMGYMDNSYSNSNNGGSVNSQDSIWQMKSAAANGVNQPYDLAGYGTAESDYPTHPHYLPQREDYRESHNLSRQQFCSEPFATVVKSQKHVDSPYDVSGLPYQENYDEDTKPPQQVSLSYDESLESGYSTPNRRRIIREIIV
ncbi:cell adhesion molecule Dscam1 isoform X2 [Linepithema humile]|uniref:cell adhesion molecule Dscam1 isoform X2 n=1 Tax=Linepithema humile TaxID=83485 RepID=UPI00062374C8|nr:PREDICTED: hemicentin-2 isoform X1 [Linepithema humile]